MENKAVNKEFVRPSISKSSIFVSNHCPVDVETSVGMHIHRELELLYQESGQKTVVTNNETYHMEQGDIILFNSNTPHEIISHPHSVDSFIQFRLDAEAKTLTSFQNYLVFCNWNVFFFKRGTGSQQFARSRGAYPDRGERKTALRLSGHHPRGDLQPAHAPATL